MGIKVLVGEVHERLALRVRCGINQVPDVTECLLLCERDAGPVHDEVKDHAQLVVIAG
ncbi:MAG: hypothetical protein KatS3mg111_0202 [Pirellulaceae bacterium]|nr:MAG: hypothetical protein KatS3mg111_0202 [Pirellulaceae bacterium]